MKFRGVIAAAAAISLLSGTAVYASDSDGAARIDRKPGDSVKVGDYKESAEETQKLIDNRPDIQRQMENITRGTAAVKTERGVFISWRWLGTESADVRYNVYRNGEKLNAEPLNATNFTDINPTEDAKYSVSAVVDGVEQELSEAVSVWNSTENYEAGYRDIPIQAPQDYTMADGETGSYSPSDVSVADLDGDMEYEIILKWDPRNSKDASKTGYTANCIIDAYKMDGTLMWRIDMGKNIRSGPHDTQFIVYDFDNDGKAEMACRTADGTVAGDGTVIGDPKADWASLNSGKNLQGPLYLTVFNGEDGSIIDTTDFYPQSTGTREDGSTWDISSWGDGYGNRSERYLAALGSFDGVHTSFVMARGYYAKTCLSAYHLENGKIVSDWKFNTDDLPADMSDEEKQKYCGQGNHSMSTADVDYDGKDEVIYGAMTFDDDGSVLYSTNLHHGDAQHIGDLLPSRPGLEIYSCHEPPYNDYGYEMRDARTGEILMGEFTGTDTGRACTADIDPNYDGEECWSAAGILTSADGTVISSNYDYSLPSNFAIWWDGDLGREIQDGITVSKWDCDNLYAKTIFRAEGSKSINSAKANPALTADIIGDWREEAIYPLKDNSALRIYTNAEYTPYKIPTLMHDTQYRNHVALQNVCYNQPTHTSFYLGYGTKTIPVPQMYTIDVNGNKNINPDLAKKEWNISDLYAGENVTMTADNPTALVNGIPQRIDNENTAVKPILNENNRTLVPLRFIADSIGAKTSYNDKTGDITVSYNGTSVKLKCGSDKYSVEKGRDVSSHTMDTMPVISQDRTLVPVRFIAEALGMNVNYTDGVIEVSDVETELSQAKAQMLKKSLASVAVPPEKTNVIPDETAARLDTISITDKDSSEMAILAGDKDDTTVWSCKKPSNITIGFDGWPGIPSVIVKFADNEKHRFSVECSNDLEKWMEVIPERESRGTSEYEKYVFGCPQYPKFIRLNLLDENGCSVSEFAALLTE